jgi:multiple sugar transport system permease protein
LAGKAWKFSSRLYRKEALWAYVFITPFLAGLSVFYVYAFLNNIWISFTNKKIFGVSRFIGLRNYIKLFKDERFFSSLGNTFKYVAIGVPAVIILAVLVACLLNNRIRLAGFYRTMIFIPAVTMPAAIGLVWNWIMNYEFGLINAVFRAAGVSPVAWLSDPRMSLYSVSSVLIWADISTKMVILLAGLQGIAPVYYEAAKIDGAGFVSRFFHITLPLLSPTVFFCLTMETIGVFQIFDFIFLMIPRLSSGIAAARSVNWLFYDEAFAKSETGYAASITMVLFLIILMITVIQMICRRYWVYEE